MGGPGARAGKIPDWRRGGDLGRHLFGGARRAVVLVRVGGFLRGGGAGGLGDAGNEALNQFDRTLQGAAGVCDTEARGVFRGWPHGQGVRGLPLKWLRVDG